MGRIHVKTPKELKLAIEAGCFHIATGKFKLKFDEYWSAFKMAAKYSKTFGERMNVYTCSFCGYYHIGHRIKGLGFLK